MCPDQMRPERAGGERSGCGGRVDGKKVIAWLFQREVVLEFVEI